MVERWCWMSMVTLAGCAPNAPPLPEMTGQAGTGTGTGTETGAATGTGTGTGTETGVDTVIDECLEGADNCDVNATCSDLVDGFECTCNAGYSGDGIVCSDDDECSDGTNNCDPDAICTNTAGSFTCACGPGTVGDGLGCDSVLFVDDDEQQAAEEGWLDALSSALSLMPSVETLAVDGDPTVPLASYDIVIWSIGDRAHDNLTAENVATLTAYLDGGGKLLYAGGHCLYGEVAATAEFTPTYLGLTNESNNMPTFLDRALPMLADGTGHQVTGKTLYSLQYWPGGEWGDMLSAFSPNLPTTEVLLKHRVDNMNANGSTDFPNEYIAAVNVTSGFKAMTWGFDINHVDPAERDQLLRDSLLYLAAR